MRLISHCGKLVAVFYLLYFQEQLYTFIGQFNHPIREMAKKQAHRPKKCENCTASYKCKFKQHFEKLKINSCPDYK